MPDCCLLCSVIFDGDLTVESVGVGAEERRGEESRGEGKGVGGEEAQYGRVS